MSFALRVEIPNEQGLHARPIALIVETAQRFDARLFIGHGEREVDGRSVLQLMTLCAGKGAVLAIRAEGEDAEELAEAVARVVRNGFGEM